MFTGQVRKVKQGRTVSTGTVRAALGDINMPIALEIGKQTLHQIEGQHDINPIQNMLTGFKNFDPSVEKKLVVHPDLPKFAAAYGNKPGSGD